MIAAKTEKREDSGVVTEDVEEQEDGPFQLTWEGTTGLIAAIFTDSDTDQIATQIDLNGTLNDPEISTWDTFLNILKNAFVEAYSDRFDGLFQEVTNEQPEVTNQTGEN